MTIQNDDRKTTPVVTDGETGIFYYDFPIFFGEDGQKGLEVRYENELNYDVVLPTEYIVLPNTENTGGYVQFAQVPVVGKNLIIVGKTQVDQQLNITNHGKFQAEAIETNFDKIVAIMQEWSFRLSEEERQRIANDSAIVQQYITAHNELKAYLEYRFDMRWQEMSDYLDSLLPMFFCIMRKELNAFVYSDEGIQNIIDQIGDAADFVTSVVGETGNISIDTIVDAITSVPASKILDVSGKFQQELNSSINNSIVAASPSIIVDRGAALTSYLNSLPRYSSVKIPNGEYYFDGALGSRVVNNSLNIDATGVTFLMSPTASGAPVLEIKNPEAVVSYSASLVLNSLLKSDRKLNVKDLALLSNPSEYFIVLTSTEVANPRVGYADPYYKNITLDIAQSDYTLRNSLPFDFIDLTKVTVTFVKKLKSSKLTGLTIKPSLQNANYNIFSQLSYLHNFTIEDLTLDLSSFQSFGVFNLLQRCCDVCINGLTIIGGERDGNDSYVFMNSSSSYINFEAVSTQAVKNGTIKPNRGYIARHGFQISFNKCNMGGIDDHWGHDYTVSGCKLGTGVTIAGGSLTVEDTTAAGRLVNLREDTPCCDGTLRIRNSYGKDGILRAYGYTFEQANTGVYGPHKVWDIIDIDVDCSSDDFYSASPIIIKEPRQNQTDVCRDTILKISGCYKMVGESRPLFQEWHQDNNAGSAETDWYTDLESKRLFSLIDVDVKVFVKNGVEAGRAPLIDSALAKSITLKSNHATFNSVRALEDFNIINSKISEAKQSSLGYLASELNLNNVNLVGSPNFFNRGSTHKVYILGGRIENQNRFVSAFGSNIESVNSVSYDDESWKAAGNLSLRNYRKGLTVVYSTATDITLASGASSSQLTASSASFNINHSIVGKAIYNGVVIDVCQDTVNEYNVRFYLRNTSGASVTIPAGTKVMIKAVG